MYMHMYMMRSGAFLKLMRGSNKVTGLLCCFISSDVLVFAIQRKLTNFYQNVLHNYLSVMSKVVLEVFSNECILSFGIQCLR